LGTLFRREDDRAEEEEVAQAHADKAGVLRLPTQFAAVRNNQFARPNEFCGS